MPAWLEYALNLFVWAVAIMSGILAIAREALAIFLPNRVQQRSLFWNCIIISFVISAGILWGIEHKKVISFQQNNKEITDGLADFRINGLVIQNQCSGGPPLYPGKTARQAYEQWDSVVDAFAQKHLTKADLADLRDVYSVSVAREPTIGSPQFDAHTWIFVGRKIMRIEQVSNRYR